MCTCVCVHACTCLHACACVCVLMWACIIKWGQQWSVCWLKECVLSPARDKTGEWKNERIIISFILSFTVFTPLCKWMLQIYIWVSLAPTHLNVCYNLSLFGGYTFKSSANVNLSITVLWVSQTTNIQTIFLIIYNHQMQYRASKVSTPAHN